MMRLAILLSAAWILLQPAAVRASDEERQQVLEAALRARAAGDHTMALERARRAFELKPTSSLLRFMAEERRELGDAPSAFELARECVELASRELPSPNRDAVSAGCQSLVGELRQRVAVLRIRFETPPPPDLELSVGGARVTEPDRVPALPPGTVRVNARAAGYRVFEQSIELEAGGEAVVPVVLTPILRPSRGPTRPVSRKAARKPAATKPATSSSPLGPILIGAGTASVLAGGIVWLVSNQKYDSVRERCETGDCSGLARERTKVERLDAVALGCAIVGVGLASAGAVIELTKRKPGEQRARLDVVLAPGFGAVRGEM